MWFYHLVLNGGLLVQMYLNNLSQLDIKITVREVIEATLITIHTAAGWIGY